MQSPNIQLPAIDRINKAFIIALVSFFIINAICHQFFGSSLIPYLGLSLDGLFSGKIWGLVTYSLIPGGLIEVIFNALIIWFIGSELSTNWGEKRYIQYMLVTVVGGAIIGLGASTLTSPYAVMAGASAFCSALCVTYGVINPERTMYFFFFPLKAKWFVTILIGMNLYNGIFSSAGGVLAWNQLTMDPRTTKTL